MPISLQFLSFAVVSWLYPVSSTQPLIATTVNPVASDSRAQKTQNSQADTERLSEDGMQQLNQGQLLAAAHTFEQAPEFHYRKSGTYFSNNTNTSAKEIEILKHLVGVDTSLKDWGQVIEVSKAALVLTRQLGDRDTELKLLIVLGDAYNSLGKYELAVESATASLALAQELQNSQAKAVAFVTLASAYQARASSNSEYQKAISAAISGLTTAWIIKDHDSEAKALSILASVYSLLGKNQNAIVFAQKALMVAKENSIPTVAASSRLTLADVHLKHGEYQKVIESAEQGRDYLQKLQQREAEAAASVMLGLAYLGKENYQKSLVFAEKGLAISREVKSPLTEALALIVLSLNSSQSGELQKAIELINQSRAIAKEQNNRSLEAFALEVRGGLYRKAGQKEQAIACYQQAISINDSYTAKAGLARVYEDLNLLGTAIIYYKQAINKNEELVRRWIPGLPLWLQESFPQAVQDIQGVRTANIYRSLANLLLSQKRVSEAQQVLELLKGQELREYTGNTKASGQPAPLTITPTEEQILKEYGSLIAFGYRLDECEQTHCLKMQQLLEQRAVLTKQYYQALEQLETKIRTRTTVDRAFVEPKQFALKAQEIVEAQPGTVLIYPLVLEDKIWLMWASKGGIFKSLEVRSVSQAQLEATVLRFRQLLQNRLSNINEVKATGKQLYDWLLKPLEQELKANNIHNLVFSLDRSTRYIPMSALFDGEKYLIENYTVSTVLSAKLTKVPSTVDERKVARIPSGSQAPLSDNQDTTVLGLGVSDAIGGFKALPNVPPELNAIVRQDSVATNGIYPGQEFLNKAFDFFALRDNLPGHQILHIATHSQFVPGRANQSFLLLGNGEKLEIPEIETWLNLRHVNLVVLSACETALGGAGLDGREIAGIGYYFLKGGAKTVIASLWNVDDRSTRLLMEQFYKNLAKGTPTSPVMKAEALRQAQLALLNGKVTADEQTPRSVPAADSPPTAAASPSVEQQGENQPPAAKKIAFRHPYYWSAFILMGSML